MNAVNNGHLPAVEYLVERGANMEAKNEVNDVTVRHNSVHEYIFE